MVQKTLFSRLLLLLILCVNGTLLQAKDAVYDGNFSAVLTELGNPEHTSFFVNSITFSCDIPLSKYEFFYLTNLKQKSFLTKHDVDQAFKALSFKKRFSSIAIDLIDEGTHKRLHVSLVANWIFKKLTFEGVWFGKSQYANLYLQQPGDVFDTRLHEESIASIKKHLTENGYYKCSVIDELEYSKKQKTITTSIKVKKGPRFSINTVSVFFDDLKNQITLKKNDDVQAIATEIYNKLHALTDSFYSKKQIKKIIRKVQHQLKEAGFIDAKIQITQKPRSRKNIFNLDAHITFGQRKIITLTGNTELSNDYIKEEFLSKESPDWLFSPDIIAQQMLHEYYKKGFWFTSITPKKIGDVGYKFVIKEGTPTIIEHIDVIDGNTYLPEKSVLILQEVLKDKRCDQALLEDGFSRLHNFYIANGFWDFKIIDKEFIKNQETKKFSLKLTIDKGTQRIWGGLQIEGFPELESHAVLKKYSNIQSLHRIPFNLFWLQEQRDFLINYFKKQGHWYAEIDSHLIVLPEQKQSAQKTTTLRVFVQWKVKRGPQVKSGKTVLRGSTTIPFKRLKSQCVFKEGAPFDRTKLDQTRKRLKRLDVFKTVQVQPYQLSKNKGKKPTIITLVDDEPVELRARVGYFVNSSNLLFKRQDTAKIGSSFIIKNPTNRADLLSFAGDWTRFERTCTMNYQQPSPLGLSALGTIKGFANKYVHPVEIKNSGSAYQALQYGLLAGLNDEYKQDYHWHINIGNEWLKITKVHGNLRLDNQLINTTLPYFFIEPGIEIDKLDSRTNTTKGSLTTAAIKIMAPEDDGQTTAKLMLEQSLFFPAYEKFIIAGRIRFGHIFGKTFDKILPNERFFLGGPYSVRGYEPNALPPLGVSERIENGKKIQDLTIQGGSAIFNANIELRFPIYKSFGAVLFQDIGILSQSGFLGFKDRWYPGSGFGFRYKTPIGSVRFDIGWKWKRRIKEDNRSYAWYLTIGEAF